MKLAPLHAVVAALALLASACGVPSAPAAPSPPAPAPPEATAAPEASTCPDDGPRLPITQLCAGRVINYVDPSVGLISETPDECVWSFTETPLAGNGEVIIQRVLTCNGVTTAFNFSAGAHAAALAYAASAVFGDSMKGHEAVRIFTSDPADPQKVIMDMLQGVSEIERAKCSLQVLNDGFSPKDALVLRYSPDQRAREPQDEPISMCGAFGRDEDATSYWRIFGGYAWFFTLGQETPDFDPGSFMVFRKGADSAYTLVD